jgi:hypothetical protein
MWLRKATSRPRRKQAAAFASRRSGRALARARSHPFDLGFAESFVGVLRQSRREARAAQEIAESLIALSAEHGFTQFLGWATSLRGWAMTELGTPKRELRSYRKV